MNFFIAFTLLNSLVLMGNESCLRSIAGKINGLVKGVKPVEVVGVDMEEEREGHFAEAVNKACVILGSLDAFVHCYFYEGTTNLSGSKPIFFIIKTVFFNILIKK